MDSARRPALLARFRETLRARLQRLAGSFDSNRAWSDEALDEALAELHTLKGEARMLGLLKLASLAHELESSVAEQSSGVDRSRALDAMRLALEDDVEPAARHDGGEGRERAQALLNEWARHAEVLAAESGKLLRVEVRAEEGVGVEGATVEKLWPALLHLLHNAVDHGLESPHQRGDKPRVGRLTLSAEIRGACFVLTVEDDGRGIAPGAIERLFEPGFTTRAEVTALSGRGVGLDAARRQVEALGGRIAVETELGQGTRFMISVPGTPSAR